MNIYDNDITFHPTWLMIKQHKTTGLLYFCKTTKFDPIKYLGSGKYWKRHLKEHGTDVDTIWCELFTDVETLVEFAISFSETNDIVKAKDVNGNKIWANLEFENGLSGMPTGTDRGEIFKSKSKINNAGTKNPSFGKYWWTDGIEEVKSADCPEGWTRGRSPVLKEKISDIVLNNNSNSGKNNGSYGTKWWTNGVDSVRKKECPEGWERGMGSILRKKRCNRR